MSRETPLTPQQWTQLEDEELMTYYQAGEIRAFETLYNRHSGRLYAYLLKNKMGPEGAQDLLQEIFARLHRCKEQYNPEQPFLPWLFTMTRHLLLDSMKKSETILKQKSQSFEPHFFENNATTEPHSTSLQDLQLALAQLPEPQQRALNMRYLNDWSFEKIADEMGASPQGVRQWVSRGLRKIRNLMGEEK